MQCDKNVNNNNRRIKHELCVTRTTMVPVTLGNIVEFLLTVIVEFSMLYAFKKL